MPSTIIAGVRHYRWSKTLRWGGTTNIGRWHVSIVSRYVYCLARPTDDRRYTKTIEIIICIVYYSVYDVRPRSKFDHYIIHVCIGIAVQRSHTKTNTHGMFPCTYSLLVIYNIYICLIYTYVLHILYKYIGLYIGIYCI